MVTGARQMSRHEKTSQHSVLGIVLTVLVVLALTAAPAAQNAEVQQKISAIKEAASKSKEALEQYRWQQQETLTVKGKMKKQDLFQVETGPEGKPMRVAIAKDKDSSSSETQHGLKQHIAEKKSRGMEQYALEIKALAQSYVPVDPVRLQQSYQHGDVSMVAGNVPGEVRLVIHDYQKPGDIVTLSLDQGKELKSIDISSYLNDPKDAVKVNAQLDR